MTELKRRLVSVLLVEDEALIRMMIAEMIEELGHSVAGEASNIADALRLAQTATFEFAILDINLAGAKINPVAKIVSSPGSRSYLRAAMVQRVSRTLSVIMRRCKSHF